MFITQCSKVSLFDLTTTNNLLEFNKGKNEEYIKYSERFTCKPQVANKHDKLITNLEDHELVIGFRRPCIDVDAVR